jgi:tetratricopeptide (TPR) repeat protein
MFILGDQAYQEGRFEQSADFFRRLLEVDPRYPEGRARLEKAEEKAGEERLLAAETQLKEERRREERSRRARACQLTADKDWRAAILAWGKVLDLSSADPASTSAMAHGREEAYAAAAEAQRKGDRQTAIDLYRMSAEGLKTYKDSETRIALLETVGKQRAEEDSQRLYEKGMAAYSAKEFESAKTLFEQALRANPDDKKAAKALERLKEEMGKN